MVRHSLFRVVQSVSVSLGPLASRACTRKVLRLALPVLLAGASLVVLLGVLSGPQSAAYAISARPLPAAESRRAAPLPAPVFAPASRPLFDDGSSVITVCLSTCPYTNVQAAVHAVAPGGTIKVAQGVYTDTGSYVVQITQSLTLQGGYTTTNWSVSYPMSYPTVLDGQGIRPVVYISDVAARIDGFHIRNGYVSGYGGGVYIAGSSNPTVTGNTIYSNTAVGGAANSGGGGVYVANGSPLVQGNYVCTNTTDYNGGGILVGGGSPTVESNQIFDNQTSNGNTDNGGGGVYVLGGAPTIRLNNIYSNVVACVNCSGGGIHIYSSGAVVERNAIHDNLVGYRGGGIHVLDNQIATIRNNLIYHNRITRAFAPTYGGGISAVQNATIENNTIYSNTAYDHGGGIGGWGASPTARNNIVYGNSPDQVFAVTCNYCDTLSDPRFVNAAGGDFHLQGDSPSIDAADPTEGNYPTADYDDSARPFGPRADIGAFEYYTGTCFAQVSSVTPATQVFTDVQTAVNIAADNALVKVAGLCTNTINLTHSLTLRGGYSVTQWTAPATRTVLDGQGLRRAVYITGTGVMTVDGFVIRNGHDNNDGGGLYVAKALSPTIQNVAFFNNTAANGGGLASAGGGLRIYNNTFVSNTATSNGGAAYFAAGLPTVSNTIVANNMLGGGLYAASNATLTLDYTDFWTNPGGHYDGSHIVSGEHNIFEDPLFTSFAQADWHLQTRSPCIHSADPGTTVAWDWEGDTRPQGHRADIGADEAVLYPGVTLIPTLVITDGIRDQVIVFLHQLINDGALVSDTFALAHTVAVNNGITFTWDVEYDQQPMTLMRNESRWVTVTVHVGDGLSGTVATILLTATSQTNPNAVAEAYDEIDLDWNPGVTMAPVTATQYVNPSGVVTMYHRLTNTGNFTDTFNLVSSRSPSWPGITILTPTLPITLGPFAGTTISVVVNATDTLPGGLAETIIVTATSQKSGLQATLSDTAEVNYNPGPRYVAPAWWAYDTLNNCHVPSKPCRTILYAVGQASSGDEVRVAAGTYSVTELVLNKDIVLRGGYTNADFVSPDPDKVIPDPQANPTILDAEKKGRVLNIFGSPTVDGFTVQNGAVPGGSGGGVFISLGSPVLRRNVIISNTAGLYGGGIYNTNLFGTPRIERNLLASNKAQQGGGFASSANNPRLWNNLIYGNEATADGGGVYVAAGDPPIWHDTIYSNTGDGIYLAGGASIISNTIVASNTDAGIAVAGGAAPALAYNDVWHNAAGNYAGVVPGPHSLSVDPLFVDPAKPDLHLRLGSPLINVGQNGQIHDDYWGKYRPVYTAEIGADEFVLARPVLAPNHTGVGLPDQVLSFTHVLTNNGNYTDTFSLISSLFWPATIEPTGPISLAVGKSTRLTLTVHIPSYVISNTVGTVIVTATSSNDPAVQATALNTVTVGRVMSILLEPDLAGLGAQNQTVNYRHTVTNTGNYTDTIWFTFTNSIWPTYTNSTPWTVTLPSPLVLGPGSWPNSVQTIDVGVSVPSNVPTLPVFVNNTVVTAYSQVSLTVSDRATDTTYVNRTFGVRFAPNRASSPTPPGTPAVYNHTVTNTGNYTDTLEFTGQSAHGWNVGFPGPVTLGGGQAISVAVQVWILGDVLSGTVDIATFTAASQFSPTVKAIVTDTTTVGPSPGVALSRFLP